MAAIGFVVPVLPGKEQTDLDWMADMTGPRRDEYESTIEAEDIPTAMQGISTSDEPFNQWFRDRVKDVHRIDLSSDPPPHSQQIHDHSF